MINMSMTPIMPRTQRRRLFAEQLETRRLLAGPYAPAAGEIGSTAIPQDDPSIDGWATEIAGYTPGSNVDLEFQSTTNALGPAQGIGSGAVSLGRGGAIELTFDRPIRDGIGPDFAIFENSFSDTFLELAFVEVSSDGSNFFRFANDSLTPSPVDAFGAVDPTDIQNLAGKYRQGFGTPFDLAELVGISPLLDTTNVTHVRLVDIVGDGSQSDTSGDPIFDPFPTVSSAGFDLDAVAVLHQAEVIRDLIGFEDVGATLATESAWNGPDPNGTFIVGPFSDTVVIGGFQSETLQFNNAHSTDFGSWNQFAYSNATNTITPGFTNQFSSFAGGGASGSSTFAIGFPDQGNFFDPPTVTRDNADTRRFESLMVTNTTYAALSMQNGDSFAKKFGGPDGNDPDFLLLTITGKDAADAVTGTVEFYLADYRFADNGLDYIIDQWNEVDLRPLAASRSLEFSVSSSDVGAFGINTPAFFAIDDIALTRSVLAMDIADRAVSESAGDNATTVRLSRSDENLSSAIDVSILPVDADIAVVPTNVTIPAGERFIEFPIDVVNNDLVHGDRQIVIEASADGFVSTSGTLIIREDDVRRVSLTLGESVIVEGNSLTATVSRNDANLSSPLTLQIESSLSELVTFNPAVTIAAGQSTSTFVITAVEDGVDRANRLLTVSATAASYIGATESLNVNDNDQPTVSIESAAASFSESEAAASARLEDVGRRLAPQSFYNGADQLGGFSSEGLTFNNDFNPTFGSWSGWSYSNTTDTTTPGFTNQYSAFTGGGAVGSDTYAVGTAFAGAIVPAITRDPLASGAFETIAITNTTYAALSVKQGDAFAKKFGGVSGDDPDFFLLTIEGFDTGTTSVGTIDFYLADYRFADNSFNYVVDQWATVDLSPLAAAIELRFSLNSSDVGSFGMNTPAYFAVDNVRLQSQTPAPLVKVSRNAEDLSAELDVTLSSNDPTEAQLPAGVTIPAGASSVFVPLQIIDDTLVDGNQPVQLEAIADFHVSSTVSITIADEDLAALSISIDSPAVAESGGAGQIVVHRNVADTLLPLSVILTADLANQLLLPNAITIPAGQRSTSVTFSTIDNAIVDGDRTVTLQAAASGFLADQTPVSIIDDDVALTISLDNSTLGESDAPPTTMLEDLGARLAAESFDNGSALAGGFVSRGLHLNNSFNPTFGSWGGWAVSNTTDTETPGFQNQYSAVAGGGAGGSATYAVASAFPGGTAPTISIVSPLSGRAIESLMVTNTTYAARSMRDGDAFAKKFGGVSGDDPDFFLLTIDGRDDNDASVGTVEFYLADFRFADNSQDYIVDQWTKVDTSSLTTASRLEFSLSSSDVGTFGMNTPAYFAADQITRTDNEASVVTATVTRTDDDLSFPLVVTISSDDATETELPSSVTIPSGSVSATFRIRSVDDAVVDGDQQARITVSASTHVPAAVTLTVQDDDAPALTLTATGETVSESAGSSAGQLLIHRNTQDVASPLTIQLTVTGNDLVLPDTVTIPSGKASWTVQLGATDNVIHDGDRSATVTAAADGFASSGVSLIIQDDDLAAVVVNQSDGDTTISELLGQDSFQVSLASRPLSDVFVSVVYSSDDLTLDADRLRFAPDLWNVPQTVTADGIPDLLWEETETVVVTLAVDAATSDPTYVPNGDTVVDVVVGDHQPTSLRVGEDSASLFLIDQDSGVRIASSTHRDGISVLANDLPQTIQLDDLLHSRGLVQVDSAGGDDVVIVRGPRFTSLDGGDGFDQLVLQLDEPAELVDFLDSRVVGFEEIFVSSDSGTELTIDGQRLGSVVMDDGSLLVRTAPGQRLGFIGAGVIENPIMIGTSFVQVIRFGANRVHLISQTPWRNSLSRWDVNQSGEVTSLDALAVVNEIARAAVSTLPELTTLDLFGGSYFDVSGDGRITSIDALQVINQVARELLGAEAEELPSSHSSLASNNDDAATRENVFSTEPMAVLSNDRPRAMNASIPASISTPHDEAIEQLYPKDSDEVVRQASALSQLHVRVARPVA